MPVAAKIWLNNNISMHLVLAFWKWLWALQIPHKIIAFRWLCVHYALPVFEWMHREGRIKTSSFVGFIWNKCNMPYGTVWLHVLFGDVCCASLMLCMNLFDYMGKCLLDGSKCQ